MLGSPHSRKRVTFSKMLFLESSGNLWLLFLQNEKKCLDKIFLRGLEEEDAEREKYKKLVIRSMFGNINASRNSA